MAGEARQQQMLLPLLSPADLRLDDLSEALFAAVRSAWRQLLAGELSQLHLWGVSGAGRSLLLRALAADAAETRGHPVLLPLRELAEFTPDVLDGLEQCDLVLLDDLDAVLGQPAWEVALFHLYNRLQAAGVPLLVTAGAPPAALRVTLPDLRSRLARASVHELPVPSDDVREALLALTTARRGWQLDDDVMRYLITRGPRRLGRFMRFIDQLDARTQLERRPLTLPLVRSLLPETSDELF